MKINGWPWGSRYSLKKRGSEIRGFPNLFEQEHGWPVMAKDETEGLKASMDIHGWQGAADLHLSWLMGLWDQLLGRYTLGGCQTVNKSSIHLDEGNPKGKSV